MASIRITVTGPGGVIAAERNFTTADENVPALVGAYIADIAIPTPIGGDGQPVARDSEWALAHWMTESIMRAVEKAEQFQRAQAAAAAAAAVPAIIVETGA